jgi:hypothetical protein
MHFSEIHFMVVALFTNWPPPPILSIRNLYRTAASSCAAPSKCSGIRIGSSILDFTQLLRMWHSFDAHLLNIDTIRYNTRLTTDVRVCSRKLFILDYLKYCTEKLLK